MKIVVHVASALINLAACEMFGQWFRLTFEMRTGIKDIVVALLKMRRVQEIGI